MFLIHQCTQFIFYTGVFGVVYLQVKSIVFLEHQCMQIANHFLYGCIWCGLFTFHSKSQFARSQIIVFLVHQCAQKFSIPVYWVYVELEFILTSNRFLFQVAHRMLQQTQLSALVAMKSFLSQSKLQIITWQIAIHNIANCSFCC